MRGVVGECKQTLSKSEDGWAGAMAQQLRVQAALARYQRLVPSTHTGQCITASNSMCSMLLTSAITCTHGHISSYSQIQTHMY